MKFTTLPPIPIQMEIFSIPINFKHDHSEETFARMKKGLELLNTFLIGGHDTCVDHMVLYAEMNIKFLFIQSLNNRKDLTESLKIFVANLTEIFLREAEMIEIINGVDE
jgi:hypothetical protein